MPSDIPDIEVVINFDLPSTVDDYVHRIGRTGRAGNRGEALSFYNDRENWQLRNALCGLLVENSVLSSPLPARQGFIWLGCHFAMLGLVISVPPLPLAQARPCLSMGWALNRYF